MLALALVYSTTSCSTVPDQKYFQKGSLLNIRRILIVTSSEDLTVKNAGVPQEPEHSQGRQAKDAVLVGALVAFPLPTVAVLTIAAPIRWKVQSGKDASEAKTLRSASPKEIIAQRLSEHFTKTLLEAGAFDSVQEMPNGAERGQVLEQLKNEDGLVRLRVNRVCLRTVSPYGLSLLVEVSGEMFSLKNGKQDMLLWSRQENLDSEEAHPIEFYRTNGIPILDASLAKLSKRLADDVIYSK